jgi:hypothetical protein
MRDQLAQGTRSILFNPGQSTNWLLDLHLLLPIVLYEFFPPKSSQQFNESVKQSIVKK